MTGMIHAYQRQADRQKRDDLIVAHLPLVRHVIGRMVGGLPTGTDVDNLESAGVLGLVEAAAKFDPTRNAQFKTFAYLRVKGAILDEMRRNSPLPQHMLERVTKIRKAYNTLTPPITSLDLATATGLSLDEVTETLAADRFVKTVSWEQSAQPNGYEPITEAEAPDAGSEREEMLQQLTEAIESLPQKERLAVTLYYKEDLRLKEIAEVMNLSTSRISRMLTKALFDLGEIIKAKNRQSED